MNLLAQLKGGINKACENGTCFICKAAVSQDSFTDELSKREYKISGMCQSCQDVAYAELEELANEDDDSVCMDHD